MKVLILDSKSSQKELIHYANKEIEELKTKTEVIMYDSYKPDFSDIEELYDNDEKIVLFNQYAMDEGFENLSKHMDTFVNVKYILTPYSSYAGLDLDKVNELGIKYKNNAGANAKAVSQYAIAAMFSLLRKFPIFAKQEEESDGSILGEEIESKTAGIIGMGNVGIDLLEILNNLGIETKYYNRTDKNLNSEKVDIDEIFEQDLVFITIATNDETIELLKNIDKKIKRNNYIIDVSAHDELYDKEKVVEMLNNDEFKGYALESTELKSTSDKNFLKTPHVAWCTIEAEQKTYRNYICNAISILDGEELKFVSK